MLEDDALLPALLYVSRPTAGLSFPNASSIVRHLAVGIGTIPYRHIMFYSKVIITYLTISSVNLHIVLR
ncbi:Uncharacterized protein APZ42_013099 [Daphnia magna]|uniref:Uncharacterized protein n=1 Tax=Daphnia magna TaxID=35525 RepID=A0A162R6B3_9CRUS|nr:Uncharacterized protein APZ42_013099 [Daphnia magna]